MNCQKCKGFMIKEQRPELAPASVVHRCINCGLVLDPLIQRNRLSSRLRKDSLMRAA
ncbi:MAG: hypothetical protein LZF86_50005 [Nitrospira sp.]|nr:MAG: hypothetical protein LZF86_50005 [Nitrospira sp.]